MREADAASTIAAIVVAIVCLGGMVFGTAVAADEVYLILQTKPIVTVTSPYAFFNVHWIGTQCSPYYACTITSGRVGSAVVHG